MEHLFDGLLFSKKKKCVAIEPQKDMKKPKYMLLSERSQSKRLCIA